MFAQPISMMNTNVATSALTTALAFFSAPDLSGSAHSIDEVGIDNEEDYYQARAAFSAPSYEVLYRRWITEGNAAPEVVSSEAIADAIQDGSGRIECQVLPHHYRHLSPLTSPARQWVPHAIVLQRVARTQLASPRKIASADAGARDTVSGARAR
ncbi:MAG TPA: hypothetical protein VEL51_20265 [Vicinamibacterales bacterium]|nr:hypothetical protein [Vicinamibacterales bacterium]